MLFVFCALNSESVAATPSVAWPTFFQHFPFLHHIHHLHWPTFFLLHHLQHQLRHNRCHHFRHHLLLHGLHFSYIFPSFISITFIFHHFSLAWPTFFLLHHLYHQHRHNRCHHFRHHLLLHGLHSSSFIHHQQRHFCHYLTVAWPFSIPSASSSIIESH